MLLITGANGKLGRLIAEEVLRRAPDAPLAVSVRDTSAAADLAERGVDVRQAEYHDLDSIRAAFAGVDRLLLMPTPTPDPEARVAEMIPVAQAAAQVGVKHIVYPGAAEVEGLDFPLLSSHTRVYDAIVATGVQPTHLRVNIYAEVVAGEVAGAVAAGELAAPVNDARIAPVLRQDIAPTIAAVLTRTATKARPTTSASRSPTARSTTPRPRRACRQPASRPPTSRPCSGSTPPTAPAGPAPPPATSSSSPAGRPRATSTRSPRFSTARRGRSIELGIISLSDLTADPHTGRPVAAIDRLDATLAYARAADELGLDVFALGEHHSHKFAVASPAVALAAIAGQTERIRLASGVTVLSALDPCACTRTSRSSTCSATAARRSSPAVARSPSRSRSSARR
jgi:uncharacterized protein YbjT (DUF2867 family)